MAKIGLCVELDEMDHPVVERVPEVFEAAGLVGGHTKVIPEASEVGLARDTNLNIIAMQASVVTCVGT